MSSDLTLFNEKIEIFETLNPDVIFSERVALFSLAEKVEKPDFGEFVEGIIQRYMTSPFKLNEREIIRNYADSLSRSAAKLIESGEITKPEEVESSTSLIPKYSETEWLTILTHSQVPQSLNQAVDAIERRKRQVSTVLEYLFELFHKLDINQAFEWELNYLKENQNLDPDIIRDLLRAWRKLDCSVPKELLEFAINWCENEDLKRLWPSIVKEADFVLQKQVFFRINLSDEKNALLRSLKKMLPVNNEKQALHWIRRALNKLTEQVYFFTELERKYHKENDEKLQLAAFKTLKSLEHTFEPFLVLSHLLLDSISGAEKIALAFMGFSEEKHQEWDKTLHKLAMGTIRRFFLNDLRSNKTPLETIKKLCFGNDALFRQIIGELDFGTKQFESLNQREKAEHILAYNYASFREGKLLTEELSRRYRRFMRMVHEDSLNRFLKPEHLQETLKSTLITEYAITAAQARKFISMQRNEDIPAEEAFAAKEEFIATLHRRRRLLIRRIISNC